MQLINSESTRLAGTGNTRQDPAADTLHDLQLAIELAGGDETLARDLLRQLVVALPTHRDRINRALEKRDMAEIQEEAHALNGGVTCCGIPRLQATLTQLEKAAMAEDIPAVRGHIKETNVMIAALLAAATPVENHDHE